MSYLADGSFAQADTRASTLIRIILKALNDTSPRARQRRGVGLERNENQTTTLVVSVNTRYSPALHHATSPL